ncbi:hypothetical protein PCASD_06230 [Puccinia coronata f. sp. avenae]|uniref:Tyr recombinase domain-containing protein n=1 Tax=Puccinia coronata f. sp. avenae TaxID=200324 RepID=A0A2N5V6M9_9BASI|nr:hypothetical protein PCASD_06230 [Puccinia coronata f. sp. avenae]
MIQASGRVDSTLPPRPAKSPMLASDLQALVKIIGPCGPEGAAIADLAIIAFWGMARLAELTYHSPSGHISPCSKPTTKDVTHQPTITTLRLHGAKTSRPGEIQTLYLQPWRGALCPVKAIARRISSTTSLLESLFGFTTPSGRVNLTKQRVNRVLRAAWQAVGRPELSGHSFRVGGASLQHALGIRIDVIKHLGRWKSKCDHRYLKTLSQEEVAESLLPLGVRPHPTPLAPPGTTPPC